MISAAHELQIKHDKVRTVVAIDPQATNSDESDETGIVAASSYGAGDKSNSQLMGITAVNIPQQDGLKKLYGRMNIIRQMRSS